MNFKRLFGGLSLLCLAVGVGLVCLTPGGLFNRVDWLVGVDTLTQRGIHFGLPGPLMGLVLIGVAMVGFTILLCLSGRVANAGQRVKRFFAGFALLALLFGAFLLCVTTGGLLNPVNWHPAGILLDMPGPIVGWCLLAVGAVMLIVVWSIRPAPREDSPRGIP